jgi:hypothetical protein
VFDGHSEDDDNEDDEDEAPSDSADIEEIHNLPDSGVLQRTKVINVIELD